MTDVMTTKKRKKQIAAYPFPVGLIDQLLAQVEKKDAESILGVNGLAGQLKKMLASACCRPSLAIIWLMKAKIAKITAMAAVRRRS